MNMETASLSIVPTTMTATTTTCAATNNSSSSIDIMELLPPPKAARDRNSQQKRRLDDDTAATARADDVGEDAASSLARSLKRVRVSCTNTPGELCLERDLKYLVDAQGWRQTHDGSYFQESCLLRHGICPSELILFIADVGAKIAILIPKAYPHRPPRIMPIDYTPMVSSNNAAYQEGIRAQRRVESILITDELQAGIWAFPERPTDSSVVLANWTPIRRLGDCLVDIICILRSPNNFVAPRTPPAATAASTITMPSPSPRHNTPTQVRPCLSRVAEGDRATEPCYGIQTFDSWSATTAKSSLW